MSEQICDICKKEPARVHIKGQGKYCLKCYNSMALERIGADDTFHYPDTMAVMEPNGRCHTFHIEHMIMGDTVCWDAIEQNGGYHFREILILRQIVQRLRRNSSEKLLKGSIQKACAIVITVLIARPIGAPTNARNPAFFQSCLFIFPVPPSVLSHIFSMRRFCFRQPTPHRWFPLSSSQNS